MCRASYITKTTYGLCSIGFPEATALNGTNNFRGSVARLLALAFRFGLLESSRYSPIPTQSSDVTTWLLQGLHYIHPRFVKKTPYQAF